MQQNTYSFVSMPIAQLNKADKINIAVITLVWAIAVILVNPIGEFPLNDDWAYAQSVKSFLETGNFQLPGWAVANLLPQALWGALFCLPFGFSFTALRFSTITLGLLGVITTYLLIKEVGSHQRLAFIGALLIAINPLYFSLSNTFMTDVPHYTVTILSLYFFVIGLKNKSLSIIIVAVFTAIISFLIRQHTVAFFAGYAIAYIIDNKAKISSIITAIILFIILPVGTQKIFSQVFWPKNIGNYGVKEQEVVSQLTYVSTEKITNFAYFALCTLLYLGCLLLPFAVLCFRIELKEVNRFTKNLLISFLLFIVTTIGIWLILENETMPIKGNILIDRGIGPLTLRSTSLSSSPIPNYLKVFWSLVTIGAAIGAGLLLIFIALSIIKFIFYKTVDSEKSIMMLNNSTAFIYFLPVGLGYFFDRYILLLLPLTIITVLTSIEKTKNFRLDLSAILSIALIGIFTIGATHDYLSWNRIRWQALNDLMQQEIPPNRIDGGFEFNGWYLYDPNYSIYKARKAKLVWWWVLQDDYIVDFNKIEGYDVVKQYPLKNWLPFQSDRILVLKK